MEIAKHKKQLEELTEIHQFKYIMGLTDDNLKYELLTLLRSDETKVKIVNSFSDENLRLEAIKFIQSEFYKADIISKISNIKVLEEALKSIGVGYQVKIINQLVNDEDKLKLSALIDNEMYRYNILETIKEEKFKLKALSLLTRDYYKTRIISTISDDNLKYKLLSCISNELEKLNIIRSFGNHLRVKSLGVLSNDSYKCDIINGFKDDSIKMSLLKYLSSDDYKAKVILNFSNNNLKIEAINLLNDEHYKINVIKSLSESNLFEVGLKSIGVSYQVKLLNQLTDEYVRLKYAKGINQESYRILVLETITDDELKVKALDMLRNDKYKAKIIGTIKDESKRFELLVHIKNEMKKVLIIKEFKDKNLLREALAQLKNEFNRVDVLVAVEDDAVKLELFDFVLSDEFKAEIINSMKSNDIKVTATLLLNDDDAKLNVIEKMNDDSAILSLLHSLQEIEKKFYVLTLISSEQLRVKGLKTIKKYEKELMSLFNAGLFEYIYHFDKSILKKIFDNKQLSFLDEYTIINNEKLRKSYSRYVAANYEKINLQNLSKIVHVINMIEMSNSSELQAFGDLIANQVLNHKNPLEYLSKVEYIFVQNHMPHLFKVFDVFKLLHVGPGDYFNYSPLLNSFKNTDQELRMMDSIIFSDLVRCAFASNNRSLKQFIVDIELGNNVLRRVLDNQKGISMLSTADKSILLKYLDKIEIVFTRSHRFKNESIDYISDDNLLLRINNIIEYLGIENEDYSVVPDIVSNKICRLLGVTSLKNAKSYFEKIVRRTDELNRKSLNEPFILEEGDFVKGINDVKFLPKILQNGSLAKEFLGDSSDSDVTPLDTDLSRIVSRDMIGKKPNELGKIIWSTLSGGYGTTWIVLKNDSHKIEITRDAKGTEKVPMFDPNSARLETFKTLKDDHYGIRTGFPSSDISYIVSEADFDKIGLEIAFNGFYIPVLNPDGKLMFTPQDFDRLRNMMSGLSYYGSTSYIFSDNLINDDVLKIHSQIKMNNLETQRKNKLIISIIKESIEDVGLIFKDKIDGDLSEGYVEFLDIGSTGRFTNMLGAGDFDYIMRLDRRLFVEESKLEELKNILLKKFDKEDTEDITCIGDFRLKDIKLDENTIVDIDITFTEKSENLVYTTEMSLQDRLSNIYKQDPDKYYLVVANIILAKEVLKAGEAYKTIFSVESQGGLGGVGVEMWILQNGGSFVDAAKDFLKVANGKSFDEFKQNYCVWDFGESHMSNRSESYLHPNFVVQNMGKTGYHKMVNTLTKYLSEKDSL